MPEPTYPTEDLTGPQSQRLAALRAARDLLRPNAMASSLAAVDPDDLIHVAYWILTGDEDGAADLPATPGVSPQPEHVPGTLVTETRPSWMNEPYDPDFTVHTNGEHIRRIAEKYDLLLYRDLDGDFSGSIALSRGPRSYRVVWTTAPKPTGAPL